MLIDGGNGSVRAGGRGVDDVVVYLYLMTRGTHAAVVGTAVGLGGAPLRPVHHDTLAAVVSTVPRAEFGPAALRRNLEDVAWLDAVVSTHDGVVRRVAEAAPVAPVRVGTVFRDDDQVRDHLRDCRIPLQWALDRVQGRQEWSVRVVLQHHHAGASGAPDIYEALAREAVTGRLLTEDARLSGHRGRLALNAAYLVAADRTPAFQARVDELAARHPDLVIDARGPRPPYSFAMLHDLVPTAGSPA